MLAKVLAQLLKPLNLSLELWLLAALLAWRGRRRGARAVAALGVLLLWVASTPQLAVRLARAVESQHLPVDVADSPTADAIVVLGGSIGPALPPRRSPDLTSGADRVLHAARLFRAGKAPRVVASSGTFYADLPPEAPDMAALLEEWGVPEEAILQDATSRTTWENAEQTRRILEPLGAKRILLVTSALHMPRSVDAFRRAGFEAIPSPTDFHGVGEPATVLAWLPDAGALDLTSRVVHELLGRAWYAMR